MRPLMPLKLLLFLSLGFLDRPGEGGVVHLGNETLAIICNGSDATLYESRGRACYCVPARVQQSGSVVSTPLNKYIALLCSSCFEFQRWSDAGEGRH